MWFLQNFYATIISQFENTPKMLMNTLRAVVKHYDVATFMLTIGV